jgi:hypothetical protein
MQITVANTTVQDFQVYIFGAEVPAIEIKWLKGGFGI